MEFNRLVSSAISAYGEPDLTSSVPETKNIEKQSPINNKNYYLISTPDEIDEWVKEAEELGEVAVDTETNSLDPHQAELVGISLSSKIGKACYIPIGHKSSKCIKKEVVIKKLKKLFYVGGTVRPGGGMPLAAKSGIDTAKMILKDED